MGYRNRYEVASSFCAALVRRLRGYRVIYAGYVTFLLYRVEVIYKNRVRVASLPEKTKYPTLAVIISPT